MRKLSLLAAASVMAMASAANAGLLELKVKNVNGAAGADGTVTVSGQTTIERVGLVDGPGGLKVKGTAAIVASERVFSPLHTYSAHIELNALRFDDDPTDGNIPLLPEEMLVRLTLLQPGGDVSFKERFNGEDFIREGMLDEGEDLNATTFGNTGNVGEQVVTFLLENDDEEGYQDFGVVLPIQTTVCEPIGVQIELFAQDSAPINEGAIISDDTLVIQECADSVKFAATPGFGKIDFQQDFKGFLDQLTHVPGIATDIGYVELALHANLFDPKASNLSDRYVNPALAESYTLVLQFENLIGIEQVNLNGGHGGVAPIQSAELDYVNHTATFFFDDMTSLAGAAGIVDVGPFDFQHNGNAEAFPAEVSVKAHIELVAFGSDADKFITDPKTGATLQVNGAIEHQSIDISTNALRMNPPCKELDGTIVGSASPTTPKLFCDINLATGPFADLILTGQNFGPFDWVQSNPNIVANFFRVSHLPSVDGHGEPITEIKGVMSLKNSSGNFTFPGEAYDGDCKFTMTDNDGPLTGSNGVFNIGPAMIAAILASDDCAAPNPGFGTSDISFTFFVNSTPGGPGALATEDSANFKIDVDRLMLSGGTLVPYGDNSNDGSSEHMRSGDEGRFGPKVALKKLGVIGGDD